MLTDMITKDLNNSFDEFAIQIEHLYKEDEELTIEFLDVMFDESSEAILSDNGFVGVEASTPSIVIATSNALNITNLSTFSIDGKIYQAIEIKKMTDLTTRVFVGLHE